MTYGECAFRLTGLAAKVRSGRRRQVAEEAQPKAALGPPPPLDGPGSQDTVHPFLDVILIPEEGRMPEEVRGRRADAALAAAPQPLDGPRGLLLVVVVLVVLVVVVRQVVVEVGVLRAPRGLVGVVRILRSLRPAGAHGDLGHEAVLGLVGLICELCQGVGRLGPRQEVADALQVDRHGGRLLNFGQCEGWNTKRKDIKKRTDRETDDEKATTSIFRMWQSCCSSLFTSGRARTRAADAIGSEREGSVRGALAGRSQGFGSDGGAV